MRVLLRSLAVAVGALGVIVRTFSIPSANHLPIGSRCGGCRWTGEFPGQT